MDANGSRYSTRNFELSQTMKRIEQAVLFVVIFRTSPHFLNSLGVSGCFVERGYRLSCACIFRQASKKPASFRNRLHLAGLSRRRLLEYFSTGLTEPITESQVVSTRGCCGALPRQLLPVAHHHRASPRLCRFEFPPMSTNDYSLSLRLENPCRESQAICRAFPHLTEGKRPITLR